MAKSKLRFGTGGFPLTSKEKGVIGGIKRIHELGLQHMELEFVQQVFVKEDDTAAIQTNAKELDVTLSVHGSYYVNLASVEKPKWHASINRILQAAKIGDACGANSMTFHSGFVQDQEYKVAQKKIKEGMQKILTACTAQELDIRISPELTGKPSQFGDLGELILLVSQLRKEGFKNVSLCIDFAHLFARTGGKFNTYEEFRQVFSQIENKLGAEDLQKMHIHISGIEFTDKGEKNHLVFLPSMEYYREVGIDMPEMEPFMQKVDKKRLNTNTFNWQDLLRVMKLMEIEGCVVCESPLLELDAVLMQNFYRSL